MKVKTQTKVSVSLDKVLTDSSQKKSLLSDVSPYDAIPMIDSLDNVSPYQVVQTTNYDLIKFNPFNRVDKKRVSKFEKLIKNEGFFHKPTIVMIDYITHMLNDNHHKVQALKNAGKPIYFMVADLGDEFRGEISMVNIAKLNDSNSSWTSVDKFKQSLEMGFVVANILSGLKSKLDKIVPNNNFKPWNILNFALGKNCEGKVSIEDYNNLDFSKILISKKFNKDFKALIKVVDILTMFRGGVRPSETIKRLSVLNGDGVINMTEFSRKFTIANRLYNPTDKNKPNIDKAILKIYNKRI